MTLALVLMAVASENPVVSMPGWVEWREMVIRHARVSDAAEVCKVINHYAERGRMLHRSLENVYESLREFLVAEDDDGRVVGCAAVVIFWADLAEIKSLAVAPDRCGAGLGVRLLQAAVDDAKEVGVKKLFALTYEKNFFANHGFEIISRDTLPEKVWRECIACPKAEACDEIAMMRYLGEAEDRGKS